MMGPVPDPVATRAVQAMIDQSVHRLDGPSADEILSEYFGTEAYPVRVLSRLYDRAAPKIKEARSKRKCMACNRLLVRQPGEGTCHYTDRRYCDDGCQEEYGIRRMSRPDWPTRHCESCGSEIRKDVVDSIKRWRRRRYCDVDCRRDGGKERS